MQAQDVFHKTAKGQLEIDHKSADLSMRERRVLILVNGQRTAAQIRQMSMVDNFAEVVDKLRGSGFIGFAGAAPVAAGSAPVSTMRAASIANSAPLPTANIIDFPETGDGRDDDAVDPREFMQNTLLRFANRVRVKNLITEIQSASDLKTLKSLVRPWYDAIAESPNGLYQVDELKTALLDMLLQEEVEDTI
ncbi:MAG: hypothetical protein AAF420_03095 [Pseudomonadota bacterium]